MLKTAEKRTDTMSDDVGAFDYAAGPVHDVVRLSGEENIVAAESVILNTAGSFTRHFNLQDAVYDSDYGCDVDDRMSGVAGVRLAVGMSVMLWGVVGLAGWYIF